MDALYVFVFTKVISTEGFVFIASAIWICFMLAKKWREAWAFFAAALGLFVSAGLLKEFLHIPRPDHPLIAVTGYAFPSGHAAGAAFLAGIAIYHARKLKKPLRHLVYSVSVLTAVVIGLSRVQFMAHTPFQVLVGYLLGILFTLLYILMIHYRKKKVT